MDCQVKICDLGHARALDAFHKKQKKRAVPQRKLSHRIMTRYYRAPEVIILDKYDFKIDIWSAGCVFAELLGFQKNKQVVPLFLGNSYDQINSSDEYFEQKD